MATKRNTGDQTPATLDTVVQVSQLIVARAKSWAHYNGHGDSMGSYFTATGLAAYLNARRRTVIVDLAQASGMDFTAPLEVSVQADPSGHVDAYNVYEAVRMALYDSTKVDMPAGAFVVADPGTDAIHPATYLGNNWGGYRFDPVPFGTDEARAEARRIVMETLAEAERQRACQTPEDLITAIGFGEFLPPAETAMTVELEGAGTVHFTVENDRQGTPRQDRMAVKIRQALSDRLTEDIAAGRVTPVAVATLALATATA